MTDGDNAIRQGLKFTFPGIVLLLCLFHILQAAWRYLFSRESGVHKRDRQFIYKTFRKSAYAQNCDLFENHKLELYNTPGFTTKCRKYFDGLWKMASHWALHFRQSLLTRGHRTNNMSEVSVRLFKEAVLMRLKARSLGQLLDMCTNQLDAFYRKRLLDLAHSRGDLSHLYRKTSAAYARGKMIPRNHFQQIAEFSFIAQSQTDDSVFYQMDLSDQLCECKDGENGSICKHLYGASIHFGIELMSLPPQTAWTRRLTAWIARGECEPVNFYADLHPSSTGSLRAVPVPSVPEHADNHNLEVERCESVNFDVDLQQFSTEAPSVRPEDEENHQLSWPATTEPEAELLALAARAKTAKSHLQHAFTTINERIDHSGDVPDSFVKACRTFDLAISKANTQTAVESVLVGRALKLPMKRKRIGVQSTTPSRRKTGNHSTLPQNRGAKSKNLQIPVPVSRSKRQHSLAKSVEANQANAHKH